MNIYYLRWFHQMLGVALASMNRVYSSSRSLVVWVFGGYLGKL
jgi:hypothetical protein